MNKREQIIKGLTKISGYQGILGVVGLLAMIAVPISLIAMMWLPWIGLKILLSLLIVNAVVWVFSKSTDNVKEELKKELKVLDGS